MANGQGQDGSKTFGGVVTIIAVLTGVAAIIRPMQQQMNMLSNRIEKTEEHVGEDGHPIYHSATLKTMQERMERIEARIEGQIKTMDDKLQIEIGKVEESAILQNARAQARLDKLEEWQKWWYRTTQPKDAAQDTRLGILERMFWVERGSENPMGK